MNLAMTSAAEQGVGADMAGPDAQSRLLARLRAGDEAAFEELVRVAGERMLAVARRMLGGREDEAQDAVQEAFLCAFRSLSSFDGRSRLTTWLHRITVNACLMRLRTQRRRPERPIDDFLPQFLPDGHQRNPSAPWKPPETSGIEGEELRSLVRAKVAELPEAYREVLMLRDIEDLSTEETAEALSLTPSAVKTRLHRARQALRGLLDPYLREAETP
jgi:RNA polymerase sigma-70 factor (ECF subfamily)